MSKETGNKKHKVRRTFITTAIITAVAAIGGVIATAALGTPMLVLSELCFGIAGLTAVVGTAVGINAIHSARSTASNRKASIKNLQKIAENDLNLNKEAKVKIAKKYAKANLRLCKLIGCPLCGKFHSVSGMQHTKETEAFNELENLKLLQSLETNESGRKKWESKISSKRKLIASSCLKSIPQRWTKSYDSFIDGISIYDRRTEIGCLSTKTGAEFESLASLVTNTDEIGASVSLTFLKPCRTQGTYARIADPRLAHKVSNLMLKDVYYACEGKTQQEIDDMFPFVVRTHTIDKKTTKIQSIQPQEVESYNELKNILGLNQEHTR